MRFSGFTDEWKSYKLGEIGLFKNGVNKSKEDFGSGYPFINLEDIFDKDYLLNKEYSLVKVSKKELKEYNLNKGDVLFVRSSVKPSGVGLTTVINENLINTVFSGFIIRFRENKQILDLNFKRYCFNITSFRNSLMSKSTTSANTNINQQSLSKLTINAPCIDEQKKIASFLEIIDKKIELLNKKSEYYIKFKKYLMQQIFTQKLRFDFDEIRLKSISKINKGKQLNKEHMLELGKFYVLNGGQEPSGYTDSWNTSENTITISEGGNSCGFVNFNTEKFWSGGHCYYLNKLSENIDVYYLYSYLKFIEPQIMRLRVGSGLPNIQKGDIENIKIKILPKKEQIKISNLLLSTDNKISSIESQKDSFEIFKKGLLQQMFVVQLILSLLQNKKHI